MMTIKKLFFAGSIFIGLNASKAQSIQNLPPITALLKKDAHSVVREESLVFEIKAINKAYYKVHEVVTILDEMGKNRLFFAEYEDKFRSLEDVTIRVFDASGSVVKKYVKKDMTSINAGDGLVTDSKYFYLTIPAASYPITVEYNFEIKYSGSLNYPDYDVQQPKQAVQNSNFTVIVPTDLDIRYKEKNISLPPAIRTEGSKKIYTWTVNDMPALIYEEGSVSSESMYPKIILSPNKFEMDGYEGDMSSWEKFGEWYGSLAKQSIDLPEQRKQFFKTLVKDAASDKEKTAIIYKYLQQNFRYVSIQLGIGGFKPFQASSTDKTKYGDCKALSNYTQACLDAVGIKSYQGLINARYNKEPVDPSFPHNEFNHVILCVPIQNDSIWLECTSNTNEFGVLGSFTENRNALLITENGGKLVATPKSMAVNNTFSTNCFISLKEDGSGSAKVLLHTTGEYVRHFITSEKKDDQKKYIVNELGFIQPDDFSLTEKNKANAEYIIDFEFEKIPSFTAGNKMFLSPRIYKIWSANLPDASKRTQDFYFPHPFLKNDTTTYHLPVDYTIEALPETKKIDFEYGNFRSLYVYDKEKNEVSVVTHLELTNYHIQAKKFKEAKTFFDAVLAEYNSKIVIKKIN